MGIESGSGLSWKKFHKHYGKSNEQIAREIVRFIDERDNGILPVGGEYVNPPYKVCTTNVEFYGYYCDYDWVLFCSLFGKMIELPKGFPMYCRDLKQMFDEKANQFTSEQLSKFEYPTCTHNVLEFLDNMGELDKPKHLQSHPAYPKQSDEHNALEDAKWNKKLFDFIKNI